MLPVPRFRKRFSQRVTLFVPADSGNGFVNGPIQVIAGGMRLHQITPRAIFESQCGHLFERVVGQDNDR